MTGDTPKVSWVPWAVDFADDTSADAASEWSQDSFNVPLYAAIDKAVPAGRCIRGWVLFIVPKGKRPVRVVYSPGSDPGQQVTPAEWPVR